MDSRFCGGHATIGCLFHHNTCEDVWPAAREEVGTTLDRIQRPGSQPPIMLGKEPDGLENAFSWYLKGDALVPGEFQPLSWYWYTSALLARAFRPNAALAKAINQALTSSGKG